MDFKTFSLREENGVLYVTLDNKNLNMMTGPMATELFQLHGMLMQRRDLKVMVMDSADPDFWMNHFEADDHAASIDDPAKQSQYADVNMIQGLAFSFQTLPQVTIAKVNGRARGAGLEFMLGFDMRFVSEGSLFGFPECEAGYLASGGGTTRTLMMAGPGRGLEILLSARDFTGIEFERYGMVNRALPETELDAYVDALVATLARKDPAAVGLHYGVLQKIAAEHVDTMFDGFAIENDAFRTALDGGAVRASFDVMRKSAQTRESELDLPASLAKAAKGK